METICIVCPNGCHLDIQPSGKGFIVTGHKCPRGEKYGISEMNDPRRVVTAVVRTSSAQWPCVPVKTSQAVPKKLIPRLLDALYRLEVQVPVRRNDTVIDNFEETGIRVVFTRSVG